MTELMLPSVYGVNISAPHEVIMVLHLVWVVHACIHIHVGESGASLYLFVVSYKQQFITHQWPGALWTAVCLLACFNKQQSTRLLKL